ncbi:IclR family transcriptional regulator domain-containing protein [Arenibaculum pallidiluteum]|uniref:IclR family transcriptional regulator domain-containing protein n=1 Tax=Arenibaculum pallidiluteum TaxID=2812559 RepID=UPI001F18DE1D|nr:IclR family transcriptional regulator C-terminal domain-containing protein [Arenibaculum pallidiluteum]
MSRQLDASASGSEEGRKEGMGGLAKGLQVILAFNAGHPNLTLSEVAEITGLAPATARRCLLTLQELGYVGVSGRRFFLRPRVLDLGSAFLESLNVEELTRAHLTELATATGDSASLSVLDGTEIVYLARASARTLVRLEAHVGSRFPAYATSMGRVLLAALPEERLRACLASSDLRPLTSRTVTDPEALAQIVARCRAEGYAAAEDELAYGVVALAVPVLDARGRVVAALNSSSHSKKIDLRTMVETRLALLREFSARISAELKRLPETPLALGES